MVAKVCGGPYGDLFRAVWGARICGDVPRAYNDIARSIAAYEGSREVNAFSSKYDAYLAGRVRLSSGAVGPEALRGQGALYQLPPEPARPAR